MRDKNRWEIESDASKSKAILCELKPSAVDPCPIGIAKTLFNETCYTYLLDADWGPGEAACKSHGGNMISVNSVEEFEFLNPTNPDGTDEGAPFDLVDVEKFPKFKTAQQH
ncbi:unnamed protein product [Cyprideis torosa]|uniref:Uncharacterized protein n=1 Tax=Cyprideis torosa TaxID=163714 RepID=A0A7R8WNA5_9CRUS|nr:unnamed protein product [Cyprideis torosa]CAG0906115.1 unnamed protein product [Cyprideis torosa]